MTTPTQPIRDEHWHLLPQIEILLRVADSVGVTSTEALLQATAGIHNFLTRELLPNANAEDRVLYPYIEGIMNAPGATATMSRDHVEIERLTEQLGSIREQLALGPMNLYTANELRRVLYGLYTLVRVHIAKEEEVYLHLLDLKSSPEEMQRVLADTEQAVHGVKAAALG